MGVASVLDVQYFFIIIKENWICVMSRHYKRGFGCVTKHKLPSQLIPVARSTIDEEIEDLACEENEEDDVIPVITITDILANALSEEVFSSNH